MKCENCGASMKPMSGQDYFFCEYCGSYHFPKPSPDGVVVLGERYNLKCPVCLEPLVLASVVGNRILYCETCRGLLMNQDTFSEVVKHLRAHASGPAVHQRPVDPAELQREIKCAACGQLMSTHPYYGPGNIVMDNCPSCALVWLDYGELSHIVDAPGRDRRRTDRTLSALGIELDID